VAITRNAAAFASASSASPAASQTLGYTTVTKGDLCVITGSTDAAARAITGLANGGCSVWNKAVEFTGGALASGLSMWWGVVDATPGAVTLTASYGASVSTALDCFQFTAGLGAGTVWSVDPGASATEASEPAVATTLQFSPLTATATGELYYGYVVPAHVGSIGTPGAFTEQVNNGVWTNIIAYQVMAASGAITGPTATQTSSAPNNWARIGALFRASAPVSADPRPIQVARPVAVARSFNY
jgi:hypothetical protein